MFNNNSPAIAPINAPNIIPKGGKNNPIKVIKLIDKKANKIFNSGLNPSNMWLKDELKPLEKLTIYQGIEIIQPTVEEPIRKYIPKQK